MSDLKRVFINQCKVNSCPLTVSHITDYWSNEEGRKSEPKWGLCEYHRSGDSAQWNAITKKIIQQKTIITLIESIQQIKDKRFLPYSNERVNDWLSRINKDLHSELLSVPVTKTNIDSIDMLKQMLQPIAGDT